jgi:hypothetical protein
VTGNAPLRGVLTRPAGAVIGTPPAALRQLSRSEAVLRGQDLQSWAVVACPEGVSKNAECIEVNARAAYTSNKVAFNSEVFGRVRLPNGESALYGDFAEASDGAVLGLNYLEGFYP